MKGSNCIQAFHKPWFTRAGKCVWLLFLLSPAIARAQRQKIYSNMLWVGHYSSIHLNERYAINSDVQFRTRNWTGRWFQQLIRSGVSYKINPQLSVTLGGAWFRHASYNGEELSFRNELRPWQEAAYGIKWTGFAAMQRLRLEQRFMQRVVNGQKTTSYDQITRLRYRLELQVPLKGTPVSSSLVNEFMVHPGYLGREKFLDQNRTFIGLNIKVSPSTTLQAQYMKLFQWRINNILEDLNVVRFNIQQQFNRKN